MSIAKRNRAERRAEWERARDLNKPAVRGPEGEDHGLDLGPAAQARPTTMVRVDGKLGGAGQRKATPVYARMVDCTNLYHRLSLAGQITDRQCQVGNWLITLRWAAGLDSRVTAKHEIMHDAAAELADEAAEVKAVCPDGYDPRTYYRYLMRRVTSEQARWIDDACGWTPENPVGRPPSGWMATFKAGLDVIADELGIKRQGVGV